MQSTDILDLWTIYDHPRDYPHAFVARLSQLKMGGVTMMTATVLQAGSLDAIRRLVQARHPYVLTFIPRSPQDDPVIVGCLI